MSVSDGWQPRLKRLSWVMEAYRRLRKQKGSRAIHRALNELEEPVVTWAHEQVRAPGAGRPKLTTQQPELQRRLKMLVEASTRGDPMSPLLWTCESTTQLAKVLTREGYAISPDTVGRLLASMGYSLQANMKSLDEGGNHPDRDRQFRYLNARVRRLQGQDQPVISVDTNYDPARIMGTPSGVASGSPSA